MKRISILSIFLFGLLSFTTQAAEVTPIANGYHIVVATFSERQDKEAQRYSENLNKKGFSSGFGLEKGKHFIYVFLQSFDFDHYSAAVKAMLDFRQQKEFATAWVVKIKDGREIKEGDPVETAVAKQAAAAPAEETTGSIVTEYIDNPPMTPIPSPQDLGNTPAFLSVVRDRDKKLVNADVKVYDAERSKLLTTASSNRYLNLPDPKSKSGKLTLVASAFGYSDYKLEIGYKQTEADTVQRNNVTLFGSYFQFTFPLTKLNTGQEVILSKVSFFNDAAIMTPKSNEQLQNLLEMLNETPTMHIRLNGHTNSNGRGKIIYVGFDKNYFSLSGGIEKSGSAKELSTARAQVIKDWLVSQGIADNRVEVVGWGGTKPLYEKDSPNARKNARVEMEVTQ